VPGIGLPIGEATPHPMEAPSPPDGLGPLDSAADECLVFDLDGRVLAANASAAQSLGYRPEDLLDRRAWELCTCLSPSSFEVTVAALRAEGPQSLLGHLRRLDGSLVSTDTHLWLAPWRGRTAVFSQSRGMRACQTLEQERDRLIELVEASSELVALFDEDGQLTYINTGGLELLGFGSVADTHGLLFSELFAPRHRRDVEEVVLPAMRGGRWEGELSLRSWASGRETPCWLQGFAIRSPGSRSPAGLGLVARDHGDRVRARQRRQRLLTLTAAARTVAHTLLESDDLNRAIFETLSSVTPALGAARGFVHRRREDGRWVLRTHSWSPETGELRQVGASAVPEQLPAGATAVLAHGEPLWIGPHLEPHLETGEGPALLEPGETRLLILPVFIQGHMENVFGFAWVSPVEIEDDEVSALQLIVDSFARGVERQVAEREKLHAHQALEAAVERERLANRYKSDFLAHMSHELRTPMNAIRGYAELLSRPHPERTVQEQWIRNLHRSTEYLLGLVHDVLDLSKIEAGHMRLEREMASLVEVLTGVEELLAAQAIEKCVDLVIEIEGAVPEHCFTDPVRLKQILVNLTSNAIKFTDEGQVRVVVRRGSDDPGGRTLEVAVRDSGIGIPPEAIGKLFQPFSQVHARAQGTGLGLQISRSLARLLGGDITVTSEVGAGSTFTLRVPLERPSGSLETLPGRGQGKKAFPRALPAQLVGKRFLVVDDAVENREVLRFLLQEAGASCDTAVNGKAGLERALAAQGAGTPFDAVLMDMNMPVMDGFEATRRLREAGLESAVIALTALALQGDEERCREVGCVAYVPKPIVPSVFYATLAEHVRPAARPDGLVPRSTAPEARSDPEQGNVLSLAQHPRFRALVERYVASFPQLVTQLTHLEHGDRLDEVRVLVHRLRGTAASYGFPEVSQAAGRCEDAIRAGRPREEIRGALQDLLSRLTVAAAG
jgi:PAS domain S-box-containing protein